MLLFTMIETSSFEEEEKHRDPPEEKLLAQIAQGDPEAFRALYRMHAKTIYAYGLSILKHHYDAEEVMQDTFLKIRSAAQFYQPMGKPLAWMLRITRNFCLMKLRKQSRQSGGTEELENSSLLSYEMDAEDRIVLEAALRLLSEEERSIILLHAVTGLKHREIAASLGKPLSTVLNKYKRGLRKLRGYLEERREA